MNSGHMIRMESMLLCPRTPRYHRLHRRAIRNSVSLASVSHVAR
jgi:hypothetical protein